MEDSRVEKKDLSDANHECLKGVTILRVCCRTLEFFEDSNRELQEVDQLYGVKYILQDMAETLEEIAGIIEREGKIYSNNERPTT